MSYEGLNPDNEVFRERDALKRRVAELEAGTAIPALLRALAEADEGLHALRKRIDTIQAASSKLALEKQALQEKVRLLMPIRVGVGILRPVHTDLYVIGRRCNSQHFGGKWNFIGGKILEDEQNTAQTVYREMGEELGVTVEVLELWTTRLVQYEWGTFNLEYYECVLPEGEVPQPIGVDKIVIADAYGIQKYDLTPPDMSVARVLEMRDNMVKIKAKYKE